MRLGAGIWVCALALLAHSKADSSTFAYGSRNNVAARSEIDASSDSTATKSKDSVTVKSVTRWIAQLEFPKAIFASYYKEPSLVQQVIDHNHCFTCGLLTIRSHNQSFTMNTIIIRSHLL
jgi:hypothetical protein